MLGVSRVVYLRGRVKFCIERMLRPLRVEDENVDFWTYRKRQRELLCITGRESKRTFLFAQNQKLKGDKGSSKTHVFHACLCSLLHGMISVARAALAHVGGT